MLEFPYRVINTKNYKVKVRSECGNEKDVFTNNLRSTLSCGCWMRDRPRLNGDGTPNKEKEKEDAKRTTTTIEEVRKLREGSRIEIAPG